MASPDHATASASGGQSASMRGASRIGAFLLSLGIAGALLHAEPPSTLDSPADATVVPLPDAKDQSSLHFILRPGVWLPRLTGSVQLGNTALATDLDFDDDLDLRELEPTFTGDLFVHWKERWQAHVSGFHFSTSGGGIYQGFSDFGRVELRPGDPFESSFKMTSFEVDLAYALLRPYQGPVAELSISPLVAFRYVDVEHREEEVGVAQEDVGGTWPSILGGFDFDLSWRPPPAEDWFFSRLSMDFAVAVGPTITGDSGYMWQLRTAINVFFSERLAFTLGFRLLELYVQNEGYNLDGGLQGIFVAGTLRF